MSKFSGAIEYRTSPIRLMFYAIFFSLILFLLLPLSRMFQDYVDPKEEVRTFELVTTPPPPPQQQQETEEVTVEETVEIARVETEIEVEPLDVQLETSLLGDLKIDIELANFNVKQDRSQLMAEIQEFQIDELDDVPSQINDVFFQRPADIGYEAINASIYAWITEEGKVEFIQFLSLNNQNARNVIREYIEKLRFTPPTKNGEVGRTKFIIPFNIDAIPLRQRQEQRRLDGATPGVSSSAVIPPRK